MSIYLYIVRELKIVSVYLPLIENKKQQFVNL